MSGDKSTATVLPEKSLDRVEPGIFIRHVYTGDQALGEFAVA